MEAEDLAVDTVNQRIEGVWAEDHINKTVADSLGPFIDTLVFLGNNQVLVSYQYGFEVQMGYELFTNAALERTNYRIRLDEAVPTLPLNDIFYCDDRMYFNESSGILSSNSSTYDYGFVRVE
jgi:hypothetical protein